MATINHKRVAHIVKLLGTCRINDLQQLAAVLHRDERPVADLLSAELAQPKEAAEDPRAMTPQVGDEPEVTADDDPFSQSPGVIAPPVPAPPGERRARPSASNATPQGLD